MSTSSRLPFFQVDAFADRPFSGNPAAVVLVNGPNGSLPDVTLQSIAAENNLAETAFIFSLHGDFKHEATFTIRWFSPTFEVPMCGHATLASAKALIDCLGNTNSTLSFESTMGRGVISVMMSGSEELEMSLPSSDPIDPLPSSSSDVAQLCCGGHKVIDLAFSAQSGYLVVRLEATPSELESISGLDFVAMRSKGQGIQGVVLTVSAPDEDPNDFYSRFFGPWLGIDEDHVTGSAHAVLGPYWLKRLSLSKFGGQARAMRACQCSARRGLLGVRLVKVASKEPVVVLSGKAVLVIRGEITI